MRKLLLATVLGLWGCTGQVSKPQDPQAAELSSKIDIACASGQCPCSTPLGTIANGTQLPVYDTAQVACGEVCQDHAVTVTCHNGQLEPQVTGMSYTCGVAACSSCTVGTNLIRNGENANLYSQAVVDCHQSCDDVKAERICVNGTLTGDANFQFATCQNRVCHCPTPDNTSYLSLDSSSQFYSVSQAACGHKCADYALTRHCVSVTQNSQQSFQLDGDASFKNSTCQEATRCSCPLPGTLGSLPDGQQMALSSTAQVKCGSLCDASFTIGVKCSNGNLINLADNSTVNIMTTPYVNAGSCTVKACQPCQVNSTLSVPNGGTYKFYNTASPDCSSQCQSTTRTCKDGAFDGDSSFAASACQPRLCKCNLPDNSAVQVMVNQLQTLYSASKPQCGQTCGSIAQSFTCTESQSNGTYTYSFPNIGTFTHSTCSPPTGCNCQLPGSLGQIQDKKTVTLSSVATVTCGQTCSQQPSLQVVCSNGGLLDAATNQPVDPTVPGFIYNYQCQNANCPACQLPGYGQIQNGASLTLYSKNTLACGDSLDLLSAQFACQSGTLTKNGQPYAAPTTPVTWYTSATNTCTGCKTPWGVTVNFGQFANFYKVSGTVVNSCGQGCKMAMRQCLPTGSFDGNAADFTDYTLSACPNNCSQEGGGAPPRLCLLPWQNSFVTPDAQIPMWSKRTVPCGDSCQNYYKLGRCQMSTGTFDTGFEYIYMSCTELCSQ